MDVDARSLADLATSLWRLRKKIAEHPHKRHLRPVFGAMDVFGLETRDYDGTPFDSGLRLRVLSMQHTADLDRDQIIETVRPAVYLRGILVQPGEVIVGTPRSEALEAEKRAAR